MVKRGVSVVEGREGLGEVVGDCCGRQVARGHGGEAGGEGGGGEGGQGGGQGGEGGQFHDALDRRREERDVSRTGG